MAVQMWIRVINNNKVFLHFGIDATPPWLETVLLFRCFLLSSGVDEDAKSNYKED